MRDDGLLNENGGSRVNQASGPVNRSPEPLDRVVDRQREEKSFDRSEEERGMSLKLIFLVSLVVAVQMALLPEIIYVL